MDYARADLLARGGLEWLMHLARETESGLAWPFLPSSPDDFTHSLYHGGAGVITALLEGWRHFGDDRYADAALRGARTLAVALPEMYNESYYIGRAGAAVVLHGVGRILDDPESTAAARNALETVQGEFDGTRWGTTFELMLGNAGAALVAMECGDLDFAVAAVEPYLTSAEETPGGVQWESYAGEETRYHNFGHGTLGIVYALAAVAEKTGRRDLLDMAVAGAGGVVARDEQGPDGFAVELCTPFPEVSRSQRISYGYCHGVAGDVLAFRMLARVTKDPQWTDYVDRCWHSITTSGLPERMYPGFWDNSGRCCGTAGVLATACDLMVERGIGPEFGQILAADLDARATVDGDFVHWSNHEHRDTPSDLEPRPSWSMGAAGIVRELMRWKRLSTGGDQDYVLALPEHLPARKAAA